MQHLQSKVEGRPAAQRVGGIPACFSLRRSELTTYWNEQKHGWEIEREPVKITVGHSSADLLLEKKR